MAELHVMHALRSKRAELAGTLTQLEQQLVRQRADLTHIDATMRLFDPDIQPHEILPKQRRANGAWFRHDEYLYRLIYDELRDAPHPMTTRELTERIMCIKAIPVDDDRCRELMQKTLLGSLNRAKETIARVEIAGVVLGGCSQAARARCQ